MRVLGIETSCDETAAAIYCDRSGIVADALYSQVDMHAHYGGVVPELASRDHVRKLVPLINEVLSKSDGPIDGVAYTAGPGLVGALLVGAALGRSLAYAWKLPALAVHHMEGHLLAPMLEPDPPAYPFVALLVSGGHTQLVAVHDLGHYDLLGESLDDAAGEAFDKTAKLLDLGYPGGPAIAKLAQIGTPGKFKFPRPMTQKPGLDFSFSGLKTAALNAWQAHGGEANSNTQSKADIAHAFQEAVVDTLTEKCRRALLHTSMQRLVIAGGVSANTRLRESLDRLAQTLGARVFYPRVKYCTDNAAMIAFAGAMRLNRGEREDLRIRVKPRWPMHMSTKE